MLMLVWFAWDYLRLRKRARKLVDELQSDLQDVPEAGTIPNDIA